MFDSSRITSSVCVNCRKCCLIDKWNESYRDVKFIPFSYKNSLDTIPVQKFYDYGEYWLACSYLTKEGCSNYKNRPPRCSAYNCLETFNNIGKKEHPEQPHVNAEEVTLIIASC